MTTFAMFIIGTFFLGIYLWDKKPWVRQVIMFIIAVIIAYLYIYGGQI